MHYRNGREAHNGDKIVQLANYGDGPARIVALGVLHDATAGNDYCNGSIAPINTSVTGACICDCLHVDDLAAILAEKGLDKRPAESDPMPDVSTIIGLKKLRAVARLHQQARALLAEGRNAEALAFAAQNGFQLDDIPKLDVAVPKELPKPVEPSPVTAQLDAILGPELVNGWPVECEATVWNTCRNPNLVLILLDDGRDAAMWTGKRRWRMGSKLRVKLDDARADPKYVAIEGTIH